MGERKGQNFYYPPDFDPKKHGSLNGYHGVHALRERANKISEGVLIIRFELPFNIYCGTNPDNPDKTIKGCRRHLGIGKRWNAEKKKVGMYYTTPIYQFKLRCSSCSNAIIIKTDPGNLDYVVSEGGQRMNQSWDPVENGQLVPEDKAVGRKLADDAMFRLEHESGDQGKNQKDQAPRLGRMIGLNDRMKDDYMTNRFLRDRFREEKKERKEALLVQEKLKAKAGLDIDILAEREQDIKMARLLSLQAHVGAEETLESTRDSIGDKDIFARETKAAATKKELALHTLKKAAGSRQKMMVKEKGFGVVLRKVARRESDALAECRIVSPAKRSLSTSSLSTPSLSSSAATSPSNVSPNFPCGGGAEQMSAPSFAGFGGRQEEVEEERRPGGGGRSGGGAAIAPPPSLIASSSSPPPAISGVNKGARPGLGIAAKIMAKYGYRDGEGLGKDKQGISQALIVEKTSRKGGIIINKASLGTPPPDQPPWTGAPTPPVGLSQPASLYDDLAAAAANEPGFEDDDEYGGAGGGGGGAGEGGGAGGGGGDAEYGSVPMAPPAAPAKAKQSITDMMRNPSKVVMMENMVGPGEVDEELEPEVKEECETKYGDIVRVQILERTAVAPEETVRIFLEFKRVESATKALVDLNGRFFGGRQVRARFYSVERFHEGGLLD